MTEKTFVLKFGGTSVADKSALMNLVNIIKSYSSDRLSIVVSALGETKKYGEVTDVLIQLETAAKKEKLLIELKKRHNELIDDCVNVNYRAGAKKEIEAIFKEIETCIDCSIHPVECFGEKLSTQIIYYMLKGEGIDISYVDAFNVIHFINGNPYFQKINDSGRIIKEQLNLGKVTITEGFIANEGGKMNCMSRGGSDQTATLIGKAIDANEVIIYSDRDGILTADPRIVKGAKTVYEISYPEAEEMAGHGTKIIYPRILEPLKGSNIPIIIKNTFNPVHPGTRIVPQSSNKGIKCITMVDQLHTSIHNPAMIGIEGFLAKVFSTIGKDIDVVISGNPIIGYTTTDNKDVLDELREFGEVRRQSVHTIAVVGEEVEDNPKVLSKISKCLAELDLEIEFISHDRQSAAIYFGIQVSEKTDELLNLLHRELVT